jgi:pimeloyl-ACP methyl ester carboxylesterase
MAGARSRDGGGATPASRRRARGRAPDAIRQRWFRGCDGTRLAWYEAGRRDGPTLMLLSGLGGGFGIWRPFLRRFGADFRLVGWDYRGLYASETPATPEALSMDHQIRDLVALVRHARVESPVLVGWSMGVQLGLELHRRHADLPRALVAIHGTSGRPLETVFDAALPAAAVPGALALLGRVGRGFAGFGPRLVDTPGIARGFTWLCRGLGLMDARVDVEIFRDVAREWTRLDFAAYARTFAHLGEHDASDLLPKIRTPTLILAGERDPLTPPRVARRMAALLPAAELALLPGATHFGLMEQPDAITEHVARFLATRIGLGGRAGAARTPPT